MPPRKVKLGADKPPVRGGIRPRKRVNIRRRKSSDIYGRTPDNIIYRSKSSDRDVPQEVREEERQAAALLDVLKSNERAEWQRVRNHAIEVVQYILKGEHYIPSPNDDSWPEFWRIYDVRDPYGLGIMAKERVENEDGNQNRQSSTPEEIDSYHSKILSLGADNRLKQILSGRDTEIVCSANTVREKIEEVLYDFLTSGKFGLLCDVICENFQTTRNGQPTKMDFVVGFENIVSKLRDGSYNTPEMFQQDTEAILKKLMIIGRDIASLAYGLSALTEYCIHKTPWEKGHKNAKSSSQINKQDFVEIGGLTGESTAERCNVGEKNVEKTINMSDKNQKGTIECTAKADDSNSCAATIVSSCAANAGNSHESIPSIRSEPTGPSWLYKSGACKRCGAEADGDKSLICDGCEAMYHISCAEPVIEESPVRSWYCAQCSDKNEIDVSNDRHDCLHKDCVVCERLNAAHQEDKHMNIENSATVNNAGKRESSLPSEERDETDNESPEPSRTAVLRLCKHCGTREEDDKKFLICSHRACHFKYYHVRCLNAAQLALKHQPSGLWYCPSCLCRACLTDKDDHLVCLCDRCDEAYHTYCMEPRRRLIPKGIWCCFSCNRERILEGMKRFEESILGMQVARNDVTKQTTLHSSKKDVKIEHEEHCENTDVGRKRDRKVNKPQQPKIVVTEQLKKQLRFSSSSRQPETVQCRELKQNGKRQQINCVINQQSEMYSITEQHINGDMTNIHKRKRSQTNRDVNKIHKRKRSQINGEVTEIYKGYTKKDLKEHYGRNVVANGALEGQPAGKEVDKSARRCRVRFRGQGQINGDLNEQHERDGGLQQRNGNKEQTNKKDARHSMGPISVLLDALDASEKMEKEASRSAANAKKHR